MSENENITGSFASSGGQPVTSIVEDYARDIIKQSGQLQCEFCDTILLTGWQFCPECGAAVTVAAVRD